MKKKPVKNRKPKIDYALAREMELDLRELQKAINLLMKMRDVLHASLSHVLGKPPRPR